MIKRVIGVLFALLTLATIVFASLEWGNYRSMVFDFELSKLFGTLGDTTEADVEAVEIEDIEGAAETAEATSEQAIDGAVMIDGAAMINGESQE